jgi:photosystem II stability/assembly factor-like uncharacterized protein
MACMRRFVPALILIPALGPIAPQARAQWTLQESHSTASLRGIQSVGQGIAWASGTGGTVLRTVNGGQMWEACAVPSGAEKLDFRAVQAFDADTAIVMSAGTGDLSRLYKTTDGCRSWTLLFSNPDKTGFWDGLQFSGRSFGALIGDPVEGSFPIFTTNDGGGTWKRQGVVAEKSQSLFAASNTSLIIVEDRKICIVTGGGKTAFIADGVSSDLPLASGAAAGGFSIASRGVGAQRVFVAVGGDYKQADQTSGTAAYRTTDGKWHPADAPPHGYRSAVVYDSAAKVWIAVGPNGTDSSADDGRNWKAVSDPEHNWNALSLPFVVGSKGRIGKWHD